MSHKNTDRACMHWQGMPIGMANLLEEEVEEASLNSGIQIFDPCVAACTVTCLYCEWYSAAR